jgi:hypothetical protein
MSNPTNSSREFLSPAATEYYFAHENDPGFFDEDKSLSAASVADAQFDTDPKAKNTSTKSSWARAGLGSGRKESKESHVQAFIDDVKAGGGRNKAVDVKAGDGAKSWNVFAALGLDAQAETPAEPTIRDTPDEERERKKVAREEVTKDTDESGRAALTTFRHSISKESHQPKKGAPTVESESAKGNAALIQKLMEENRRLRHELMRLEDHLTCPISFSLMDDPVICSDGQSYERSDIEDWLKTHDTSPITNDTLMDKRLIPNIGLRNVISQLKTAKERNEKSV